MSRVSRRAFVSSVAAAAYAADFHSNWSASIERPWLGPDYWSNPMQDWRVRNGRIECTQSGGERSVFLLTRELTAASGDLSMDVRLGRLDRVPLDRGWVGFRFGIRGHFSDYRDSAVHGDGYNAGILADGRLFVGAATANAARVPVAEKDLVLRLKASPSASGYAVTVTASDTSGATLAEVSGTVAPEALVGGLALVCSAAAPEPPSRRLPPMPPSGQNRRNEQRGGAMRFWFRDWNVSGSKVSEHKDRAFGPIYFAMHTLSSGLMKMTVQMAAMEAGDHRVKLEIREGGGWREAGVSGIDAMARTAHFRVAAWKATLDVPYRVLFGDAVYEGVVRKDPREKAKLIIGALTCTNDLGFPHQDIVRNLRHHRCDILLFTGDQIYERVGGFGIQMEPLEPAVLDYQRKWLLFGWSFRELARDTPIVCMPDDHDVYHGNVWGSAGKKAILDPNDPELAINKTKAWQDSGGFKMPAEWVNMVQRTQTSHLPDPFDPTPVLHGITVYYTSMVYGGVSFAIVEDRKWKSSPRTSIPWADIQNGWAQNPKYKAPEHGSVPGVELLGARQIAFLEKWGQDWTGADVKVVVSQTLWANLATLPAPANNDDVTGKLPILAVGAHPQGEVCVADHDSNGWPQGLRTLGLRMMRKAMAFHIGGDQHLGSTVQYGIEDWNDGAWAICTPAVANIFPRRWYPPVEGRNRVAGSPRYCGEFTEGFGNKITVHAVANPATFGAEPAPLHNRAPGYGVVEVEHATRKITFTNWPRSVDASKTGAKPYPGWPVSFHQFDNGLNTAKYKLPAVRTKQKDAVVQVVEESNKEVLYTVRIIGRVFTPRVFRTGKYTVRVMGEGEKAGVVARRG
ncbi:MAG: alkaline phosphatase D family protein [Acidobacteria bacterium]|nr:alkaline phosphatase D family protein [Acidobacteriota bacterium]